MQILTKKIGAVVVAGALGALAGAGLGYGPLLKYQSEGVLNMEMGTAEYKRLSELSSNPGVLRHFMASNPPPSLDQAQLDALVSTLGAGKWSNPIPKLSRLDVKDLPDLQREQGGATAESAYLGVRLTATSDDPVQAAGMTRWLGGYYKDAATLEAVRHLVHRWTAEAQQFSDRALEQKLKMAFAIDQVQSRVVALRQLMVRYPNTSQRDSQQVLDVRKDNEKFMSPLAQLVAAESEIIQMQEAARALERGVAQHAFAKELVLKANVVLDKSHTGSESMVHLAEVIQERSTQIKTPAEQEKLVAFAADLSQISARFLSQAQFIAEPSVPTRPQSPGPLKIMVLCGVLLAMLTALLMWRNELWRLLQQDEEEPRRRELV